MARVSFTVDGNKLQAEEGSLLLPVLLSEGIKVPHFCYHDALGADGNCRMCMVEIEGKKRPQIACDTAVKKDMVVNTKNENITAVKRDILELELLSHPVDCAICDQAGECSLQDYYMDFGLAKSRRPKEEKNHKNKKLDIGRNIILDQERCVLCTRCTRFTQEITHTNELCIIGRGDDARVSTVPGEQMHTKYAMNIIDLCPVGALTSKDFRFRQRVWFMNSAKSICHGCAKGCNIHLDHNQQKYQSDTIFRFRPRINHNINGHFICDDGRLSYKMENENRLEDFYHLNRLVSQENALSYLLHTLHDEKPLLLISPSLSTEELVVIMDLAKRFGLQMNAFSQAYEDETFGDSWLRSNNTASNLNAIQKLGIANSKEELIQSLEKTTSIINFNHKGFFNAVEIQNKTQIHFLTNLFEGCKKHSILLPMASFSEQEGTLINEDGILQKFEAGLCNERKSLLELLHVINASPATASEVWKENLETLFCLKYETIPNEGVRI